MGVADEEGPDMASEVMEEPTASGVDATTAKFHKERLPAIVEQEMVVETVPQVDVPLPRVDEEGPSGIVASPVAEVILENMQVPSGKPKDVRASSGIALDLPIPSSADNPALIILQILSTVLPQSANNMDIVLGAVTGPHAIVVKVLLKQFLDLLMDVVPALLYDPTTSKGAIARLEILAGSIRYFDASVADRLKLVIDRLRIRLNVLKIMRLDLEASVAQTASKLKVARMLELENLEQRLEAKKKRSQEFFSIAEEVKARHQKRRNDLEETIRQIEEMERALATAKAREAHYLKLSRPFERRSMRLMTK